ncbi:proprotein convertase subtilisin/kexin type 7 isoform X2 [Nematostella vectensis]|uniref:proprotein convertase subtilisin/kexin type 7 isoform X2 n=1 Tax=Nematostella vectensis TaxID=45351 RepID=UPI0020773837|nr:proprotein convertase subtilisin/kexin type 7 isoform X2 [Nematostella vectensis]
MVVSSQRWRNIWRFLVVFSWALDYTACQVDSKFYTFVNPSNFISLYNVSNYELSSSWAIKIPVTDGMNGKTIDALADRIAHEAGLTNRGQIGGLTGHYLFLHESFTNKSAIDREELNIVHRAISNLLRNHPNIIWSRQEVVRKRHRRSLQFKDQYFPSQWHLDNLRYVGHDINVTGVWENNITGQGVVVSVIDDGVEWTNPDILDNYSPEGSWDINSNDEDPMPRADDAGLNHHGTRCAGEIAAVPNTYCAVGVAYGAKVSGVRILDGPMTDSLEAMAFNTKMHVNDIYSCSWGPDDNGKTVDGPHQLAQAALAHGVLAGRHGYGSIFVVASGNGGHFKDNCNFDGYANSIYTVTIGAIDELGDMPYYAEHCAAMLAVTYSSGQGMQRNIVTTDWRLGTGTGCTDKHTGTSAAAPLAAGMIALMLQARPCLTWRDVQHVIAITAVKHDVDDDDYHSNGANYHHSHKYGFGVMDSWRIVNTAKVWRGVPWMTSWSSPVIHVNRAIPAATNKLVQKYTVSKQSVMEVVTLEHVTVTVNIHHRYRGNLIVNLVSPQGTTSKLATARHHDRSSDGLNDWTFSTVRNWGESPVGTWQLVVIDNGNDIARGFVKTWRVTLYGSSMTPAEIRRRQRMVEEASSGKFLHNPTIPSCPPLPEDMKTEEGLSERMLKILLLFSAFCFLIAFYYILDVVCDRSEAHSPQPPKEMVQEAKPSPLIPAKLDKEDWKRLSHILERGNQDQRRPSDMNGGSVQRKPYPCSPSYTPSMRAPPCTPQATTPSDPPPDTKRYISPTEESRRMRDFEKRLRYAMEQSLLLQSKQMNELDAFQQELEQAREDTLLSHALQHSRGYSSIRNNAGLSQTVDKTSGSRSLTKPLKGILKKGKSYLSSSR